MHCHLCATVGNASVGRSSKSTIQQCTLTSHVSFLRLQPDPVDVTFEVYVIWAPVRFEPSTQILTISRIFSRMLLLWFSYLGGLGGEYCTTAQYRSADKSLVRPRKETNYSDQDLQHYTKNYGVQTTAIYCCSLYSNILLLFVQQYIAVQTTAIYYCTNYSNILLYKLQQYIAVVCTS